MATYWHDWRKDKALRLVQALVEATVIKAQEHASAIAAIRSEPDRPIIDLLIERQILDASNEKEAQEIRDIIDPDGSRKDALRRGKIITGDLKESIRRVRAKLSEIHET